MLRAMPQAVFGRLRPKLDLIKLSRRDVIYEADAPIQHVYFLDEGLISYVKAMQDGRVVEIGAVGIEGMTGANAILGIETAIFEAVVQVPGTAQRLDRKILQDEIARNEDARVLVQRYLHFTISELGQTAACNRLHSLEERCCRWLLIAHDSARSDVFPLTHEFLAMMLGVQRAGVSITASILQRAGFISYKRGRVTIVDRPGLEATACECYAATRAQLDQLFRPSVRA
jgi:CRP-like cAMP-binding protein